MPVTLAKSVPAGAWSASASTIMARCHECSAEFSRRSIPASVVCLSTDLSLPTSPTNAICSSSRAIAVLLRPEPKQMQSVEQRGEGDDDAGALGGRQEPPPAPARRVLRRPGLALGLSWLASTRLWYGLAQLPCFPRAAPVQA